MKLLAILLFMLPPVVSGLVFARIRYDLTRGRRCTLAYWSSVAFYAVAVYGANALAGRFREGLVDVILGFFRLFLPVSLVAVAVCWVATIRRK